MTTMDLLQYIGAADDKYIMESRHRPRKRRPQWPLALAACAALTVICGAGALILRPWDMSPEAPANTGTVAATPEGSAVSAETTVPTEVAVSPGRDISAYDVTLLSQAVYPEAIGVEDYDERRRRWTENQVSDDTKYALNAFAYSTASQLLQNQTGSGCYSPLSLYQALSVLASGAGGQTQDEILSLLGQGDMETLADQAGKLYRVNYSDNEADVLRIANSLWLDNTAADGAPVTYQQDWVLSVSANYYADVYQAEFSNSETAQALGAWIAERTGGSLNPGPEALRIPEETVMAIVNTVWYRSHWAEAFAPEDTAPADFTTETGETVSRDFMHRTDSMGEYIRGQDYTKAYLRLSQGKMIFVLPDEGVDVDTLLTEARLWEIFENGAYQDAEVRWSVPKFETDAAYDLEEMLQQLGVTTAFTERADFSAISDSALFLSKVQQGTHIAVNEEGVEAAAYTMIGMEAVAEPMEEPEIVEMNLNRPFIYLITANDGTTAFIGVVRNPSES